MLESLEERLTPSAPTQTAGSYTDLVNAIAADTAANTDYVIQITNGFQFNSGGQVSISKLGAGSTLTIEGQNGINYTLTGNGNRLFTLSSGRNVTFTNLTLTGGSVTSTSGNAQGGAILDQGVNMTLNKVTVKNNLVQGTTAEGGGAYKTAEGGGVYISGGANVVIRDSILSGNRAQGGQGANGTAPRQSGGLGGAAMGGGLYVTGSGWNVTLMADTLSGNMAIGGNGGNGAASDNAADTNGSPGGSGGNADGGAACFNGSNGSRLTILNDLSAPSNYPSIMIDNTAQGGNGGSGGISTGGFNLSGVAGNGGDASGGALYCGQGVYSINIGNTSFYANKAAGGNLGAVGALNNRQYPQPQNGGAFGGGLYITSNFEVETITIVNSTVAQNTATGGGSGLGTVLGGGVVYYDSYNAAMTFDNNTITQNTLDGAAYFLPPPPAIAPSFGSGSGDIYNPFVSNDAGIAIISSYSTTLLNNVIKGNLDSNHTASDFFTDGVAYASNNLIGSMNPYGITTGTNIVGNPQAQLGNVVGVDVNGQPTGGPIYYPLLSRTASIGAGNADALFRIASVEGTTNTTDEIGNPRSSNGSINLGAVQVAVPSSSYALILTYDPTSQIIVARSDVSFTASASGKPKPTVQWQVSTDGDKTFTNIKGASSTILTLHNVTTSMSGYEYRAVFANNTGSVISAAATLTIATAPAVTYNPVSETVDAGQYSPYPTFYPLFGGASAYYPPIPGFSALASGNPTPTVQWQVSTNGGKTFTNIDGATNTTLYFDNVTTSMNGYEYRAVFTNMAGTAVTSVATLTVNPVPVPPPPPPPVLNVPPLLTFFESVLGATETVNSNGTVTVMESLFGIPVIVSTFDSDGNLMSVDLFGFLNITFLFAL